MGNKFPLWVYSGSIVVAPSLEIQVDYFGSFFLKWNTSGQFLARNFDQLRFALSVISEGFCRNFSETLWVLHVVVPDENRAKLIASAHGGDYRGNFPLNLSTDFLSFTLDQPPIRQYSMPELRIVV